MYKRQLIDLVIALPPLGIVLTHVLLSQLHGLAILGIAPVSYTHLRVFLYSLGGSAGEPVGVLLRGAHPAHGGERCPLGAEEALGQLAQLLPGCLLYTSTW